MFPFPKPSKPTADLHIPSMAPITPTPLSQAISQGTANVTTEVRKTVPSIAKSIDTVLDTAPATPTSPPVRPPAKLRPSWIGPVRPDRPSAPGAQAMKQHVIVEYSSPGLQPPVYIFTNLSERQWEAVEMRAEKKADGAINFSQTFDVEEGEYQYKFRLGPGDWWACDESKPMVDDGAGNKNNSLVVKAETLKSSPPQSVLPKSPVIQHEERKDDRTDSGITTPLPVSPLMEALPEQKAQPSILAPRRASAPSPPSSPASLMKQAGSYIAPAVAVLIPQTAQKVNVGDQNSVATPAKSPMSSITSQTPQLSKLATPEPSATPAPAPLTKHEASVHPSIAQQSQQPPESDLGNPATNYAESDADADGSGDENDHVHVSPLLRHESLRPSLAEQEHAPLFRHESIALGNTRHDLVSPTKPARQVLQSVTDQPHGPEEVDPHDPSLEKFPTDHTGIIEMIQRAVTTLPQDDIISVPHSSPLSQALTSSSRSINSMQSIDEDAEKELERIREVEEEEYEREIADGEEVDPLREVAAPMTPPMTDEEPEDADFEPKILRPDVVVNKVVTKVRGNMTERIVDLVGGEAIALAIAVGLLVLAAGLVTMQL